MPMTNLLDLTVLNTRPSNNELTRQVEALGGIAIELPVLEIQATTKWQKHLPNLKQINIVMFFSANAVKNFFSYLNNENIVLPSSIKVITIGKASANALKQYTNIKTEIPEHATSENLLTLPILQNVKHQQILLIKGEGGRSLVEEQLLMQKAIVYKIEVYKRILPKYPPKILKKILNHPIDIFIITSVEAIHNLFTILGSDNKDWVLNKPCIVLSKRIAKVTKSFGIKTIITTYDNLLEELFKFNKGLKSGK